MKREYLRWIVPVDRSRTAVIAGWLGLLSIFPYSGTILAPFAIWYGILALRDLKKNPDKRGKGRAWFGIVMGCINTMSLIAMIVAIVIKLNYSPKLEVDFGKKGDWDFDGVELMQEEGDL